jgi:glutaryl-CoA dehydrogenase
MRSRARRDGDDWVLNGSKMWITNGSIADVAVVWANAGEENGGIRGFVVPTDTPGFAAHKITHKMSLRASVTAELTFDNLRLPADAVFPDVAGLKGPLACLSEARYGIVWGSLGAARSSLDAARRYSMERVQFGRPIAGFQLMQELLVQMLGNVTASLGMAVRNAQLLDAGRGSDAHSALAKEFCASRMRETVAWARQLVGGNGVILGNGVGRYFADAEALYSFEGTREMNTLIVGKAVTGHSAFVR